MTCETAGHDAVAAQRAAQHVQHHARSAAMANVHGATLRSVSVLGPRSACLPAVCPLWSCLNIDLDSVPCFIALRPCANLSPGRPPPTPNRTPTCPLPYPSASPPLAHLRPHFVLPLPTPNLLPAWPSDCNLASHLA